MTNKLWYLQTHEGGFAILAASAREAKQFYRETFGINKMPSGSVISTDPFCGFFTVDEWQHIRR